MRSSSFRDRLAECIRTLTEEEGAGAGAGVSVTGLAEGPGRNGAAEDVGDDAGAGPGKVFFLPKSNRVVWFVLAGARETRAGALASAAGLGSWQLASKWTFINDASTSFEHAGHSMSDIVGLRWDCGTMPTSSHQQPQTPVPAMPDIASNGQGALSSDAHNEKVKALLDRFASVIAVKDRPVVERKLRAILQDGSQKLHVVADFDNTITKYWVNGQRNPSSHGILMRSDAMTEELRRRTDELYAKYYPIEISHTISKEDKIVAMREWWEEAHVIILESRMNRSDIVNVVKRYPIIIREGVGTMMARIEDLAIPVLVFSAGLANIIEEILRQHKLLLPHLHIVSNQMLFDEETGIVRAFADPLIHVFNKSEAVLPDAVEVARRPNVLLMGDSIGDLQMSSGLKKEVELTLGFLNHDEERLKGQYVDAFDVVLLGDPPMDFVNALLELME